MKHVKFKKVLVATMAGGDKEGKLYAYADATINDLMNNMNADAIWVGKKIYDEDDGAKLISELDHSKELKIV